MSQLSHKTDADEFRLSMSQFIREHFAEILGEDILLLDKPEGLDLLCQKYLDRQNDKRAA